MEREGERGKRGTRLKHDKSKLNNIEQHRTPNESSKREKMVSVRSPFPFAVPVTEPKAASRVDVKKITCA